MRNIYYPFKAVKTVQTYDFLERAFQWELEPTFNDLGTFNFTLEASETPDFSQLIYTVPAGASFYVVDNTKLLQSYCVALMYRVKLVTGSGKTYYSNKLIYGAEKEDKHQYRIAREITRKQFVRQRYVGQRGWILKRKNYGELAEMEVDPITGDPMFDRGQDLGTGISGGYHKALAVTYCRENIDQGHELSTSGFGVISSEDMAITLPGFPLVAPYDILVTDENTRYNLIKVAPFLMPGTDIVISQSIKTKLLPMTDPIYTYTDENITSL